MAGLYQFFSFPITDQWQKNRLSTRRLNNINTEVLDKTINISEKFFYNLKMKESVILSTKLTG